LFSSLRAMSNTGQTNRHGAMGSSPSRRYHLVARRRDRLVWVVPTPVLLRLSPALRSVSPALCRGSPVQISLSPVPLRLSPVQISLSPVPLRLSPVQISLSPAPLGGSPVWISCLLTAICAGTRPRCGGSQEFMAAWNTNPTPFVWTATVESILGKLMRCRRRLEQVEPGCTKPRSPKTKQNK